MLNGDRVFLRFKLVVEIKDFIVFNRNIFRSRVRVFSKFENNIELDRRFCVGKNDFLVILRSFVRKRRIFNVSRLVDIVGLVSLFFEK